MLAAASPTPPSPSQSDSQGLSPTDFLAVSLMQDHGRGSYKATPMLGGLSPSGFSLSTGNIGGSGEASLHGAALSWERDDAVNMSLLLLFF